MVATPISAGGFDTPGTEALHDAVVQELFALGLTIQSWVTRVPDDGLRPRLAGTVEAIDRIIHDIRSSVFGTPAFAMTDATDRPDGATAPDGSPSRPGVDAVYVHDFVAVDLPLDDVVQAFSRTCRPELLGALVQQSWSVESAAAEATGLLPHGEPARAEEAVVVVFGTPRTRADGVVVPVRWWGREPWLPSVDADLEMVAFGPSRSHLHLLGQFDLPDDVTRCSPEASLVERLTVAVVRHALDLLSTHLVASAATTAGEPPAEPGS